MKVDMNNESAKSGVYMKANGEKVEFSFRTFFSAADKVEFVNSVTDTVVGDHYNYVIRDLIFDFYLASMLTDVDVSAIAEAEGADTIDKIDELVNGTTLVDIVKLNLDNDLIDELENAVALNIEYKTGIHSNPIASSLGSLFNTIERKIEDIDLDSMMGLAESISGISGELTPEKMLEAYANTDIFKKNWANSSASETDVTVEMVGETPILSPDFEV